jgi:hypothetical protein
MLSRPAMISTMFKGFSAKTILVSSKPTVVANKALNIFANCKVINELISY